MRQSFDSLEDLDFDQTLTDKEMRRVIRFMLAFEDEAFHLLYAPVEFHHQP